MSIRVRISGVEAFKKALSGYGKTKSEELVDEVNRAGIDIDREAKILVPVDTGRLRSSIHNIPANSSDPQTGESTGEIESKVVTNVDYAAKVEHLNTPYLFPAFEKVRPEFMKKVERILNRI